MLEYAVRPYQTPGALGRIIIPSTPGATIARATLTWGAEATMPTVSLPTGASVDSSCCKEKHNELSRETEDVRITQQDKPQNYIDVRRSAVVKLRKETTSKCEDSLSQMSGVAAGISESLEGLKDAIHASDNAFKPFGGAFEGPCEEKWFLNNNTASA